MLRANFVSPKVSWMRTRSTKARKISLFCLWDWPDELNKCSLRLRPPVLMPKVWSGAKGLVFGPKVCLWPGLWTFLRPKVWSRPEGNIKPLLQHWVNGNRAGIPKSNSSVLPKSWIIYCKYSNIYKLIADWPKRIFLNDQLTEKEMTLHRKIPRLVCRFPPLVLICSLVKTSRSLKDYCSLGKD